MSGAVPLCRPVCLYGVNREKFTIKILRICRPYVCGFSGVLQYQMMLGHSEIMRELLQFTEGYNINGKVVNRWLFIRHRRKGKAGFGRVRLTYLLNGAESFLRS